MDELQIQRSRLDALNRPVAIVHEGMFVYANLLFLKLLGRKEFAELEAIPILDCVVERHQERLKEHLNTAQDTPDGVRNLPEARLTMVREDGGQFVAIAKSHRIHFDGERCSQMEFLTQEDVTLKGILRNLPWGYYLSFAFLLLFSILPPMLLLRLDINNAPAVYFPDDAPAVINDNALREKFPNDQIAILLFEGVALFSDGFLNALDQLVIALESHPLIDEVVTLTNQDHISGSEEGFLVAPLLGEEQRDLNPPSQRPSVVTTDDFALRSLVSEDATALSMAIVPVTINNSFQRLELVDFIQETVDQYRLTGYLTATAGQISLDVAELRSMFRDNMIFNPITVIIGLSLIWWLFRRWLAVVVSGITIGVVISSTVAFYVLFGQSFTLISSIIPPLLSALTVAALVHFFNAMHYASQRGLIGPARVRRAMEEIQRPARFTALTTAAGLASLSTSPIPPIKTFGLISACGVLLIYFVVFIVVPAIFSYWDHAPWPTQRGGLRWMDRSVHRLARTGIRYPYLVLGIASLLFLVTVPQLWNVKVETNFQEFFPLSHPIRESTERIQEKLVGTTSLQVVFETPETDGMKLPANLHFIKDFQSWVEQLPEVDKSISPVNFIEEMNWGFNEEQSDFRHIPDDEKLLSQYLLIYDGEDLYDFLDQDYRTARVNLNVNVHSANLINSVMEKIAGYLEKNPNEGMTWKIAGYGRLFADMEELLVRGQVYSLWGALGLIFLLMLVLWRSFGQTLLCMIPNLSPILLIFIFMGLFGIWLDMATAMIASVAVGIAVDDTIHVFHGFITRLRRGSHPVTALMRTYRQAGRAVMTTTIILCSQFMVLVASQFVPTANFGLLTSIGLWAALLFDLLLMPALLVVIYRPRNP